MDFPDIDPRLSKWPFMKSPTEFTLIIFLYLIFVKVLGPAYMRKRQPYNLRTAMIAYNLAITAYNAWIFYKFGKHGWFGKYNWFCAPIIFSVDEDSMGMVTACWHFFISKIIELLDTVFFILRKKNSQVTFLHVFHHSIVPLSVHYGIRHGASGYSTYCTFMNSFVHIWMYIYYGLAAMGPSVQKYLWWKKYLTTLQLIQFCIIMVFNIVHIANPGCEVNMILIAVSMSNAVIFLVLFLAFYRTAYKVKPQASVDSRQSKAMALDGRTSTSDLRQRPRNVTADTTLT